MPKRWSEPGWDRWFKVAIWALLLAVLVYGIVLLGSALARRFRAIKGSYQVPAAQYKRLCAGPLVCAGGFGPGPALSYLSPILTPRGDIFPL